MAVEASPRRYRFTVDEYERLAETGIFHEDERVELIEGEIVEMVPIGDRHGGRVRKLIGLFTRVLGDRAVVDAQNPVRLSDHSEPQPDLVLLRPSDHVFDVHPAPSDVLLLVEVGESSVAWDRNVKVPLYARAGIPEVWLLDLKGNRLEVYRSPETGTYAEVALLTAGDTVRAEAFPDVEIAVADILG